MRSAAFLLAMGIAGCTHLALERRTVSQASTLSDLQYQQVLDNLAMFAYNPDALPWHLKLKDGLVQVTDQASGGIGAALSLPFSANSSLSPSVGAQHAVVAQWGGEPTTDPEELALLAAAYRKAADPHNAMIDKEIRFEIWRLVASYDAYCSSDVFLDITVDAVQDEWHNLEGELQPLTSHPMYGDLAQDALNSLTNGFREFVELVNTQRLGQPEPSNCEIKTRVLDATSWFQYANSCLCHLRNKMLQCNENELVGALAQAILRTEILSQREVRDALIEAIPALNPSLATLRSNKRASPPPLLEQLLPKRNPQPDNRAVRFLAYVGSRKYVFPQLKPKDYSRNPGLINQAEQKIETLSLLVLGKMNRTPFFERVNKSGLPRTARHVGRYSRNGRDYYICVAEDRANDLKKFTLQILTLAPNAQQDSGRGAAYSPSLH